MGVKERPCLLLLVAALVALTLAFAGCGEGQPAEEEGREEGESAAGALLP